MIPKLSFSAALGLSKTPSQDDEVLSKPVGRVSTGGQQIDFYAARRHTIKNTAPGRERQLQVLVNFLGELQWINTDPSNVVFE